MRLRMLDVLLSQMGLEKRFGFAKTVFVSVFVLLLGLGVGTSMGVERAGTGGGGGGNGDCWGALAGLGYGTRP